jgi:hypothetical protein
LRLCRLGLLRILAPYRRILVIEFIFSCIPTLQTLCITFCGSLLQNRNKPVNCLVPLKKLYWLFVMLFLDGRAGCCFGNVFILDVDAETWNICKSWDRRNLPRSGRRWLIWLVYIGVSDWPIGRRAGFIVRSELKELTIVHAIGRPDIVRLANVCDDN